MRYRINSWALQLEMRAQKKSPAEVALELSKPLKKITTYMTRDCLIDDYTAGKLQRLFGPRVVYLK